MKYKVTYYADGPRTIIETKIEETELTKDQLLGHQHVISVEEVKEEVAKPKVVEKPIKPKAKK